MLSVSPTSVSVQANAGTNAPSQTVRVSNAGNRALKWSVVQASASWLSVSPTSGVNSGTLTLTFRTSALAAGPYQTSFRVESTTDRLSRSMCRRPSSAPPAPAARSADRHLPGEYIRRLIERIASGRDLQCHHVGRGRPRDCNRLAGSGSSFPVGTTPVQVTAQSSDGQTASCGFSVTVTYSHPRPRPRHRRLGPSRRLRVQPAPLTSGPAEHPKRRQQPSGGTDVLSASRGTFADQLDHAEDGQYLRRRVRRDPRRHRLDDDR